MAFLVACVCNSSALISAEKTTQYWTTNSLDEVACKSHLNVIFEALQEYQRRNQSLPRWLSELVPDYIHDPQILVCPFVLNTGNLKKWRADLHLGKVFDDPGSCSYGYEFRTPLEDGSSIRLYRRRQMELVGFGVPIVRCVAHRPALNLGFDGSIYRNPKSHAAEGEWEDIFAISPKYQAVLHKPLLTTIPESKLVPKLIDSRKPETDARMLDLSTQYNTLLFHLSQIDQSGKLLAAYPEGVQKIGGIDFDIRGLVHLGARQFPIPFPEKIEAIPVNRKCASIHFLHGATAAATNGSKIASFILHFTDGRTAKLPIIYGTDVRARWFDAGQKSESENPKPAWTSPADQIGSSGKSLRLYVSSWKNKTLDSEVASVEFVSHMTESAPFLLAITAE